MSLSGWKLITLFVEGEEDRIFAERILKPRLQARYDYVQIHTHANTPDNDLKRHFSSLKRMGSDYLFVVDYDTGPCFSAIRSEYAERYTPHLPESQVLAARRMIEAWYTAGVPDKNPFKAHIPHTTEDIDKQAFIKLFGNQAKSRTERRELLQQILELYDWELALQRSQSLRYCAVRLGIAE